MADHVRSGEVMAEKPFHRVISPASLPDSLRRPVVAIGNFDGVHRGHKAVIGDCLLHARNLGNPAAVLTFEPHPRQYFRPDEPLFRLTPADDKADIVRDLGLDGVIETRFDAALASLTAEQFIDDLLVRQLGVAGVCIGHDFHFGRGRAGSPEMLRQAGQRHGFHVSVTEPVAGNGEVVSSSGIRNALAHGDIETANAALGHRWFVSAIVEHGEKRGRDLGYPTANLKLDQGCALAHGIYAVEVRGAGFYRPGVASFGRRPTFDNGRPLLEVFLFDFAGNLYGQRLTVAFAAYLRPELKFDSIEALIQQMDDDSARARQLLGA
jgi:riboflavin kinase/FMN adenylyltransferase